MKLNWSQRYEYTEQNVRAYAPNVGLFVYKISEIWVRDPNDPFWSKNYPLSKIHSNDSGIKELVIYVGKAYNLRARLLKHISVGSGGKVIQDGIPELSGHLETVSSCFCFAEVKNEEDLNGAWRALYDHYERPYYNKYRIPEAQPVEINFEND
jgi:hypothetical protein